MRWLLFLALLVSPFLSEGQKHFPTKKKLTMSDFYLEYESSNKTVIIREDEIEVTEWEEKYDNPVSSTPSSRKAVIRKILLSPTDLKALKDLIDKCGFMTLAKDEYGASPSERYYQYELWVTSRKKYKHIVYRSNPDPSTEQIPKAFSEIEKRIDELVLSK